MRIQRVRKRDGREVPYDRSKIESAVARAEAAAGDPRPGFAAEIGDLVERLLERRFADPELAVPGIEDIQDLVERALVEMGAAPVAKVYILYREKRAQVRAALLVRDEPAPAIHGRRSPRVEAKDGAGAWSKGRIVAALMSEADLPRASAEAVAARVEARVFAGGSRSISTALVRELVDNELVELGFEGALRRQRPIGVPRHDLRNALLDPVAGRPGGRNVEAFVADEVLSRYAMEDLLPPFVAERVRAGDLDFEDLGRPHLPLALAVPIDVLVSGGIGAAAAPQLLRELGVLATQASRGLSIEGAEPLISDLARAGRGETLLGTWLGGLAAVGSASGREIEIVLREPRSGALEPLLLALHRLERESEPRSLPRVVLEQASLAANSAPAREAAANLLRRGLLVPCWSAEGEGYAGPGLARRAGERGARALAAATTLNLPRLARRAGVWREDALFEAAAELIDVALDGLAAIQDFQRQCRDSAAPRASVSLALSPVGLREALSFLGDGELRAEHAGRLVAFLVEAGERLSRARGLELAWTPRFGERSAERFARLDAAQFRVRQPWLFAEPGSASGLHGQDRAYGTGFSLQGEQALLAAIGSVPTCSLFPADSLRALAAPIAPGARDDGSSLLGAWESLHRRGGRSRGSSRALFALPALFPAAPGGAEPVPLFAAPSDPNVEA